LSRAFEEGIAGIVYVYARGPEQGIDPMGLMRFIVSPPERLTDETIEQAYLSGMEGIPWLSRTRAEQNQLLVERAVPDSANLFIPWDVPNYGRVVVSTASLMERGEPYRLPLELARGKLGQLRNQLADWQAIGLNVPEAIHAKVHEATALFSRAVVEQKDPAASAQYAETSLRAALEGCHMLTGCYTEQAIAVRRRGGQKLPAALGASLGPHLPDETTATVFVQSFNAVQVPLAWRQIEATEGNCLWSLSDSQVAWAESLGLRVYGGPLMQLDRAGIPDWLCLWDGDFENILSFATDHVQKVVARYRGRVNTWICASRPNMADVLSLSEEEVLRLAARIVETVRALDPNTPLLLSFAQPWAEYLRRREVDYPPLHFADALIRSRLGLGGLMLEMNMGYHPGGTLLRDPLELSRRMDQWSYLGLPLHLTVCVPSAAGDDPLSSNHTKVTTNWSAKAQQGWIARYVPLMLAKPYVHGVLWQHLSDAEPHEFPHGGLFDARRAAKPALRTLSIIRHAHLR